MSSAYQKILETSDVFNNSKDNSTLRKIICMEVAPPCDNKSNNTLLVPCKTTCEAAFNESKPKFKEIFKSSDYCSAFLKTANVEGQDYCVLQEWPNTGYWPSDLWKRVSTGNFTTLKNNLTFYVLDWIFYWGKGVSICKEWTVRFFPKLPKKDFAVPNEIFTENGKLLKSLHSVKWTHLDSPHQI